MVENDIEVLQGKGSLGRSFDLACQFIPTAMGRQVVAEESS